MRSCELDRTAGARIYTELRRSIILGRRRPGTRLSVEALREDYGTSITPVREALQMLSREGLVTTKPRSGFFVTQVTLKRLTDMLELRQILECASVERAATRITDRQLAELEHVHAGYTGDDDESYDRYMAENRHFHCLIALASGNQELADMLGQLHDRLTRYLVVVHTGDVIETIHRRHIDALQSHDAARACRTVLEEMAETQEATLLHVIQEDGGFWPLVAPPKSDRTVTHTDPDPVSRHAIPQPIRRMTMDLDSFWKPSLTLMNESRRDQLHAAATHILDKVGLNVHHPQVRLRLAEVGARLGDEPRVYLPPAVVDRALQTAKKEIVVYNRLGQPVMPLGPHQIYFGTGSDLIYTLDVETGERRRSALADVARSARVCDALQDIDFVMSFALPSDVPNEDAEPQQFYAILQNTLKPSIMTSFSGLESFERLHEMAVLIAGGDAAFRQRPNYIMYGQFVSPFQHDRQAVERLVFCAEKEIPLIYIPTIIPSASGPITLAGSLAVATAETLAGLVMHQAWNPGAPFIFGACTSQLDMRTMLYPYGSPEWRLNDLVMAEQARSYGLPVFGTGGASDSKLLDAQAGFEYSSSLLVAALAGTNLIHDVGYLDSGLTGSLESLVLGAENIKWVKRFLAGIEVSDQTLALDAVADVGPGGTFLDHQHTIKNLRRSPWKTLVTDHDGYEAWAAAGAKDYARRAREHARTLLATHQVPALEVAVDADLRRLCKLPA